VSQEKGKTQQRQKKVMSLEGDHRAHFAQSKKTTDFVKSGNFDYINCLGLQKGKIKT